MAKNTKEMTLEEKMEQALVPREEWPYEVPENWCWCTIGAINQYLDGSFDPMKQPEMIFELYSVPSSAYGYPEIVAGAEIGSSKQKVNKEDVLLCKINPRINRVWKVSQHTDNMLLASSEWIIIRNEKINSSYLMYCLKAHFFREYMLSNVSGVGGSLMRAQPKYVKKYPIPIAPLAEQQRIVERIESLFAKLDDVKEITEAIVNSSELRKSAILHKAFTGELTAKWRKEHGVGMESWETHALSECCKIGSGGTPSRKNPDYYQGTIPWIKTGEIDWNEIYDAEEKITNEAINSSSAKLYEAGAVLVAMYGMGLTRGRAAVLKTQAATNQAVCVLQPNKYLLNTFLYYFFMRNYWDLREQSIGGNQLNLSGTIIGQYSISVPSIEEQNEIINILNNMINQELQIKEIAESVLNHTVMMKKAILASAFRGELGTNVKTEENSIELLKSFMIE